MDFAAPADYWVKVKKRRTTEQVPRSCKRVEKQVEYEIESDINRS